MRRILLEIVLAVCAIALSTACLSQSMPDTQGMTLSGNHIALAEVTRGHRVVLVAGFSHAGGMGTGAWLRALRADPALAGIAVYQVAMLEKAPGFVRGMIKSGMRKGLSAAEQDRSVVLTKDEPLWRSYFGVSYDKDPYVALLGADGKVVWHGHGAAGDLEPQLRAALQ
ncbi:MAG TPA: hypothetical protein VFE01_07860 [Terracidiphilus sp.]|jgi:hypothetical protein|nr:hypothetical protein [Terracidiphilus sp.]